MFCFGDYGVDRQFKSEGYRLSRPKSLERYRLRVIIGKIRCRQKVEGQMK